MARVNKNGYLERRDGKSWRSWWLVKQKENRGLIGRCNDILLPEEYIGKRIRFRVEIVETDEERKNTFKEILDDYKENAKAQCICGKGHRYSKYLSFCPECAEEEILANFMEVKNE